MTSEAKAAQAAPTPPLINEPAAMPISRPRLVSAFIILYVLFAVDFAARLGVTTVFPQMQKDLGLSDREIGLIGSAVLLGMSAFVLPISFLADKYDKRRSVSLMGLIWGVGSFLTGLGSSFITLLFGRLCVGIGNSAYAPVSVSMLTNWVRKARWGALIGLYNSSMSVGIALGTMLSGALAQTYGWRSPFFVIGGLTVVFAVLALSLPRYAPATEARAPKVSLKEGASVTLKNKSVLFLGLGIGIYNMIMAASVVWMPAYFSREMGWDPVMIGARLGTLYLITGLIVAPLSGVIADRLGKIDQRSRAWFGVPCMLVAAVLGAMAFKTGNFVLLVIASSLSNLPIVGVHSGTQELVPARYKASSYGTYVIIIQGLGLFGPALAGFIAQAFGVKQALIVLQCGLLLSAIFLLIAGFTYMSDFNKARSLEELP